MGTVAVCVMLIMAAFGGGFLLGHGTGTPQCRICRQPLPLVHLDGRCGDAATMVPQQPLEALLTIERRLRHGIYATTVEDDSASVLCDCGWTVEMLTLAEAREEHRQHVDGGADR